MSDSYKPVSKYYDLLSKCYSLGQIPRCRNAFTSNITADASVCFVGAGHGTEAILAAEQGAQVTVVDVSQSMLGEFQKNLDKASDSTRQRVTIILDDITQVLERYDIVVSNFFLNVFPEPQMLKMLDALLEKCNASGCLVIGDFIYQSERNGLIRLLQKLNWFFALKVFRLFVRNAQHPIYNYQPHLQERGWEQLETRHFGVLGVSFYESAKYARHTK